MEYNFETSLPVELIMSMHDFTIPVEGQTLISGPSLSENVTGTDQPSNGDDDESHEHIWLNGEVSWKL